jgi:hypothetical protein
MRSGFVVTDVAGTAQARLASLVITLAVTGLVGCNNDSPEEGDSATVTGDPEFAREVDRVVYVNDAALDLRYHQETAADVIKRSDQVAIVTAESVSEFEDQPLSRDEANEPRPIFREITFRVEASAWHRPGKPRLARGETFSAITGGLLSAEPERRKTVFKGIAFIERGERYLMPIKKLKRWQPLLPLATFPIEGSEVRPAPFQSTRLARRLSGVAVSALPEVFAAEESS